MSESLTYTNYTIEKTFSGFIAIWLVLVNAAYAIKDSLAHSSARSIEFNDSDFDESYRTRPIQQREERKSTDSNQDTRLKEQELLALVRDRKTCERLLRSLKKQYPDATRLWIVEKAISDIHRDRRAY